METPTHPENTTSPGVPPPAIGSVIERVKAATGIKVANCSTCSRLGSEGDGPEYNGNWPICNKHARFGYLKSFPFKKEMKCWEPEFWKSKFTDDLGSASNHMLNSRAKRFHAAVAEASQNDRGEERPQRTRKIKMSTETINQPAGQSEPLIVAVPSSDLLGVGASVTWCHSSSNGRSIGFTTRRGKIIDIDRARNLACSKYRGKLVWLPLHRFRSASARTELTEFIAGPESAPNVPDQPRSL